MVQGRITDEMRRVLDNTFTREEVCDALKSMKPTTVPDPDGMPAIFSKKFGVLLVMRFLTWF